MEATKRNSLKDKKRIVIKIGSASLTHPETGELNLTKIEKLIRVLSDLRGEGKEVVLVSSGAIAAGRQAFGHHTRFWKSLVNQVHWNSRPLTETRI